MAQSLKDRQLPCPNMLGLPASSFLSCFPPALTPLKLGQTKDSIPEATSCTTELPNCCTNTEAPPVSTVDRLNDSTAGEPSSSNMQHPNGHINGLSPLSLPTTTAAAASASMMLLGAGGLTTPKGRGGGATAGPALVVFSGGTAFNVIAGVNQTHGGVDNPTVNKQYGIVAPPTPSNHQAV